MTKEYLKSRQKNYKAQSANSKLASLQTAMENEPKTPKIATTPDEWNKEKIKVIHKKGDVEDVSNYRPICSLPAMYKLFSSILSGRLYPMLDQNQAEDQADFRKTYQTTDQLCDVQNDGTEMPRVGNQNVDCDGGLHEGFRLHLSQFYLGGTQILQCRSRIPSRQK